MAEPFAAVELRPLPTHRTQQDGLRGGGFEVVGQVGQKPGDDDMHAQSFMEWPTLAKMLEPNLLHGPP